MITFKEFLKEDAPTNSIGSGAIATHDTFMGSKVFPVSNDIFHRSLFGKKRFHRYDKYVGNDDVGEEIKNYARQDLKRRVILKNERTGEMIFLNRV